MSWLKPGLAGLILLIGSASGISQDIACLDLNSEKVVFIEARKKSPVNPCRKGAKVLERRENLVGEITISGSITHQNGVRMSGITLTLIDHDANTEIAVISDETGFYGFGNLVFGTRYQLVPSLENYEFYPPSVTWEGIVEAEVQDFIAVGPPPTEPPVPPGTPTLAWTSYYDGPSNYSDYNAMLARDADGNVYLAGTSFSAAVSGDTDMVLSKTDPNGNLLWSRTFNGTAEYKDGVRDIAVDAAGNVVMTGYSYSHPTEGNFRSYDMVTLKYDPEGNLLWTSRYAHRDAYDDFPRSLKLDAAGNAYVTGYSWDEGLFADYATIKYDADGNQVWAARYSTNRGEAAREVEVDAAGNVYVTGSRNGIAGGSEDFLTIKYDPDGNELWQNAYNSPDNNTDEAYELELDADGNVYVMGESYDPMFTSRSVVQKINGSDGSTIWSKDYRVTSGVDNEYPTAMKLDSDGNVILAGMTNLTGEYYNIDSFVAKFDADGQLQWEKTYDGPSNEDYDGDTKLALDSAGNVYIGATSEGFANADMEIIKYSAAGEEEWHYRFGSPYFQSDLFTDWIADNAQTSMLVDESGNVYVAGESSIPGQAANLVAFKLEPEAALRASAFDFDGDKKADLAVFRPQTGNWYVLNSSNGTASIVNFGLAEDKIVPADYDGDGKYDHAVFRNGDWYILRSSDGGYSVNRFGTVGDIPVPSDFDNDGRADLGVFREGIWHQLTSSNDEYKAFQFGLPDDVPVPSDFDRNRRSDLAVYRNGIWHVQLQAELPVNSFIFGVETDKAVPADYDGDGQTDHAVFRDGVWFVWQSRSQTFKAFQWGVAGDIPVPADYDGDKKADFAVYRGGTWYILHSSDGNYTVAGFGLPDDIPVAAAFTR